MENKNNINDEKIELISKIIAMDDDRFALFINIIDRYDNEEYYNREVIEEVEDNN